MTIMYFMKIDDVDEVVAMIKIRLVDVKNINRED